MSIGSIGASGSAQLNQILARKLARLDAAPASPEQSSPALASTAQAPAQAPAAIDQLNGGRQTRLSDRIVSLLVQLQQVDGMSTQQPTAATLAADQNPPVDPVHALFGKMDSNGDGTISQAETEQFIQGIGGTQTQGDALYAGLTQNGTQALDETRLAAAATQGAQEAQGHHHGGGHHHAEGAGSADAAQIFSALDTNKDGVVSQEELAAAMAPSTSGTTATGQAQGTTSSMDPAKLFNALDGNKDGSVSQGEVASLLETLRNMIDASLNNTGNQSQSASAAYAKAANLPTAA
jgi:Ca2+-binding EF-hand superfamily protein